MASELKVIDRPLQAGVYSKPPYSKPSFSKASFSKASTVNIYRCKAIGANATSSVISTTWKCISPCLEILQLLQVILQPLQELKDFQTGSNASTGIQNYTGCCISHYSFVPINVYSVIPFLLLLNCFSPQIKL